MEITRKIQIRTNSKQFENFGVYLLDCEIYGHYNENRGDSFTCLSGHNWIKDNSHHQKRYKRNSGKFINQENFNHGTIEITQKNARLLTKKLNENARNCWVRLYYMD